MTGMTEAFVDSFIDHPCRQLAPAGVRDYLAFLRYAPLETWVPPEADFAAVTQGVPGREYVVVGLYCHLAVPTNQLYFLQYKGTLNREGVNQSFTWFNEEQAKAEWTSSWRHLLAQASQRRVLDGCLPLVPNTMSSERLNVDMLKFMVAYSTWGEHDTTDAGDDADMESDTDAEPALAVAIENHSVRTAAG